MLPEFSVIIPCREIDEYTKKCIEMVEKQPIKHEIIVVSDKECSGLPASKRNWGMARAIGKYLAFIDSDAYPHPEWLYRARASLGVEHVVGVCGPGVLPPDSTIKEHATDLVLKCLPYSYRVTPRRTRIVAEFPTFNLVVHKDIANRVGKFQPYLTGEDSLFCREISNYGVIVYNPGLVVYHYRRPLFKPYWRQTATYGLHRGHLIRLALLGWLSTFIVYSFNFIRGFCAKSINSNTKTRH